MGTERFPPTDPRAWLRSAQNNLIQAKTRTPGVYLEIPAFHAQQAAEMAIKAVFIVYGLEFPYVHDLTRLLTRLDRAGVDVPLAVRKAGRLTRFASATRYPHADDPVTESQYDAALDIAETVVAWADEKVRSRLAAEGASQND